MNNVNNKKLHYLKLAQLFLLLSYNTYKLFSIISESYIFYLRCRLNSNTVPAKRSIDGTKNSISRLTDLNPSLVI